MREISRQNLLKKWGGVQKQWLWICVAVAITASRICWYAIQKPYLMTNDSREYIGFDTSEVLRGNLSATLGRPPLYGIFLDIMARFFGNGDLVATKFFQVSVSLLSIFIFAKLLHHLGVLSPWCQLCVFLYGISPAVVGWENTILTESFSLSGTVIFFYWIVLYIKTQRLLYGALAHLMALALIFLRPQFLVYLALLLVFLVLKLIFPSNKRERKKIVMLLILQAFLWGGIAGYCALFYQECDVFSLTTASVRQNLKVCIDREYYGEFDDETVANFITEHINMGEGAWTVCSSTIEEYGQQRINDVTKKYFSNHLVQYVGDTFCVMASDLQSHFYGYGLGRDNIVSDTGVLYRIYNLQMGLFQFMTVAHALVFSVLEGVTMVVMWVRRRTLPWVHMALFSISMCTTFLTYFVTCGEYMRTMISIVPYLYCIAGMFLQMCTTHFSHHPIKSAEEVKLL